MATEPIDWLPRQILEIEQGSARERYCGRAPMSPVLVITEMLRLSARVLIKLLNRKVGAHSRENLCGGACFVQMDLRASQIK